ncbi:hypothetical protein KGP36_02305 [Patescibacteria group bacterium]|nr:hypothetical protein [Patescibacteria group bacterium]
MDERGPHGTIYATCPDCKAEVDMICPNCHPECEKVFDFGSTDPATPSEVKQVHIPPIEDIDHIQVRLSGSWSEQDLDNMAQGFQAAAEAAKEDGLGMEFVFVTKRKRGPVLGRPLPKEIRDKFRIIGGGHA